MSATRERGSSRRWVPRRRGLVAIAGAVLAVAAMLAPSGPRVSSARAASTPAAPTSGDGLEPQIGLPAYSIVAFGASPAATSAGGQAITGEAWAYGSIGAVPQGPAADQVKSEQALLQRTDAGGWQVVPVPDGTGGAPLQFTDGAQNGRATPDGGVALLGVEQSNPGGELITVDPGSTTATLSPAPPSDVFNPNAPQPETLLPTQGDTTIPFAAVDDSGGHTGVFIAPQNDSAAGDVPYGVLHYDGNPNDPDSGWSREPINVPTGVTNFLPEALACGPPAAGAASTDSPANCWLLAQFTSAGVPTLGLFGRVASSAPAGYSWVPETVTGSGPDLLAGNISGASVSPLQDSAQMLTVTSQGVWVDFSALDDNENPNVTELVSQGQTQTQNGTTTLTASSLGAWCTEPSGTPLTGCTAALPEDFPVKGGYLSFAWPTSSGGGDLGTRIITGGTNGSLMEFAGTSTDPFTETVGDGGQEDDENGNAGYGDGDNQTGAAFASPTEGWITTDSSGFGGSSGLDYEGEPQVVNVLPSAQVSGTQLTADPVPFGSPLLAVAAAPGSTPGDPSSAAFAVGLGGEVAQYQPGAGWTPQALLNGAGQVQTPTLRGVAWPEAGRAYAVGDNGAMWLWESATGQWEPDPAKPFNFDANLTGIAFAPGNPDLGYAVGKDGTLLSFGKTWTQVPLPPALQNVDFTSIAFAGGTALASYRDVNPTGGENGTQPIEAGGLAVDTPSGWQPDTNANSLLASLGYAEDTVLSKVAGLSNGGAVAAGPGVVIETGNIASDAWSFSPEALPEAQQVSALAAFDQPGGGIGAIVSIDLDPNLNPNQFLTNDTPTGDGVSPVYADDVPYNASSGQPPAIIGTDPYPDSGYLLEQTSSGWQDMEHETYPTGTANAEGEGDVSVRPDPVFGLLVNSNGSEGLAVGGQTGATGVTGTSTPATGAETAGISRFGAGATGETQTGTATITTDPTQASFVLGGDAACVTACAEKAVGSLAPDVSLTHAVSEAGEIQGVRDFLYAGGRLPDDGSAAGDLLPELDREQSLLQNSSLPIYVAPSVDVAPGGSLATFLGVFGPTYDPGSSSGVGYYSFPTNGSGGPVMVIVLDFSAGNTIGQGQLTWLQQQLLDAKDGGEPAIVVGNDALNFVLPDPPTTGRRPQQATNWQQISQYLVNGGASAYLFDYPQADVQTTVTSGGQSIPAFGSGTLGYVEPPRTGEADSLGSSAMLVVSVQTAKRNPQTNIAPVTAAGVPNISGLAMDATAGTLLRRSQVALFDGLARRAPQGSAWQDSSGSGNTAVFDGPDPYDPIPDDCLGTNCSFQIPEQFSFTSSNPSVGNFVEHDSSSSNPLAVALSGKSQPIPDSSSGLFCAFNAGTTTATLTAGGLTYSLPITVEAGSVEYPCGTVPATMGVVKENGNTSVSVPPIQTTQPHVKPKVSQPHIKPPSRPPVIVPPAPPVVHPPAPVSHPAPTFPVVVHHVPLAVVPVPPAGTAPIIPVVPPPPPVLARPVPPSGTSQVPSNSPVAQNAPGVEREREKLAATQGVDAMAAHDPDGPLPIPAWTIGLMVLAAAAGGAGMRRRSRPPLAWAEQPRAGSGARSKTWHRPPPGGGR